MNTRSVLLTLLMVLVASQASFAQSREYKLKAAFIYNFIKFVEWPGHSGPIKVGVLGEDPFKGELKKLEAKKVGASALKVMPVKDLDHAKHFQVVFVTNKEQGKKLIQAVKGKPVLTISDSPGFSQSGGGINLMSARNRIRFSINTTTLKAAGLKASSKLLGLAAKLHS